jgi:pimeloyl-ACP methyl ester carboxylesterase
MRSKLITALLGATAAAALAPAGASAAPPTTLQVGSETVQLCQQQPVVAYCGHVEAPLDRGVYAKPTIRIAFRWYPADDGNAKRAAGTVVPVEGGPGYPSIGSVDEGYAPMYGSLLRHWNMLAVDNRGTGDSTVVNCPALQDFSGPTATEAYELAGEQCAKSLDERWHAPDGEPIYAQDLFTTAAAAADMAEVIGLLGLGKVDLYGDSYGSYYAQVFAARYPQLIRSLTLDSTYGGEGEETLPFTDHDELIRNLDHVCERWAPCSENSPETPWATIGRLAAMLRSAPISGTVPGTHGKPVPVTMNVIGLVDLLNDAAGDKVIYGELDAAARAALGGYDAPLLRLYEQRLVWDEDYFGEPVTTYSVGLYTDVTCTDYAQLYNLQNSPEQRRREYEAVVAAAPPGSFAPFSAEEWIAQDQNTNAYSACLDWPAPKINTPPFEHPGPELPASMPVLVLGGELDVWTPPAEVAAVMEFLGGHSRYIELANATHVVGEADTPCGDSLVREFVKHPGSLDALDAACAAEPPIHAVGLYAASLTEQPPATLVHGAAETTQLRLISAAVQTAGDAITRLGNIHGSHDTGLNGGAASYLEHEETSVRYAADQLVPGVPVTGEAQLSPAPRKADGNVVKATLKVRGAGQVIELKARWTTAGGGEDIAHVVALIDGRKVTATVPAP